MTSKDMELKQAADLAHKIKELAGVFAVMNWSSYSPGLTIGEWRLQYFAGTPGYGFKYSSGRGEGVPIRDFEVSANLAGDRLTALDFGTSPGDVYEVFSEVYNYILDKLNNSAAAQGRLMEHSLELAKLFIRHNWAYLDGDSQGLQAGWRLDVTESRDTPGTIFNYRLETTESKQDFTFEFDVVTGALYRYEGPASLSVAAGIMQRILEMAKKQTINEKGPEVTELTEEKRKEVTAKLKGIVAGMNFKQMLFWIQQTWAERSDETFVIIGEQGRSWEYPNEVLPIARQLVLAAFERVLDNRVENEPVLEKEDLLRRIVGSYNDERLAALFRSFHLTMGMNYFSLQNTFGGGGSNWVNFGPEYYQLFGELVAKRLDAKRITEDMVIVQLGKQRPVNPMIALKAFTQSLEEFIDKGPKEPNLTTSVHTLSQEWIDWYRNVHSCSFALAWTKGAYRVMSSEKKPEELGRYNLIPNNSNPLKIELSRKLELIQ